MFSDQSTRARGRKVSKWSLRLKTVQLPPESNGRTFHLIVRDRDSISTTSQIQFLSALHKVTLSITVSCLYIRYAYLNTVSIYPLTGSCEKALTKLLPGRRPSHSFEFNSHFQAFTRHETIRSAAAQFTCRSTLAKLSGRTNLRDGLSKRRQAHARCCATPDRSSRTTSEPPRLHFTPTYQASFGKVCFAFPQSLKLLGINKRGKISVAWI